jgi:hypothetical protein
VGKNHDDPVDHHRTTQPHAGAAFKSRMALPFLILLAGGMVAAVSALASAGYMAPQWTGRAGLLGVAALVIGITGITVAVIEHRRIGRNETRWVAEHHESPNTGTRE